jgi:PAS domain S-box-containing protein
MSSRAESVISKQETLRVLLVEDEENDAALLKRHLARAGFDVQMARIETASEMTKALAASDWDVVISDYNLPEFSAMQALRLVQTTGRELAFIVTSGAVSEETAVAALQAGAQDYVSKQNLARLVPAIQRSRREIATRAERRLANEAVTQITAESERQRRLYQALLSSTTDLVYIFDLEHRFSFANDALLATLGRTWEKAIGKTCLELGYPDWHAAMHNREIDEVVATKRPISGEVEFTGTEGPRVYEYIFVPVLSPEGRVEAVAGTSRDISRRKSAEDALRKSEKLAVAGRLAASISHEINNPLEAVTNLVYLIRISASEEQILQYARAAEEELARVSHVVTHTLRFHRQSSGPVREKLSALLDSAAAVYKGRLNHGAIQLLRDYRDTQPVTCLPAEVRQLFANLIGNAFDATRSGGTIRLRTRDVLNRQTGEPGVRVTVADTGHGMDADTMGRLFEPFFSTKGINGTGLGLWISKDIVHRHDAELRIKSQTGRGSVFSIWFPLSSA